MKYWVVNLDDLILRLSKEEIDKVDELVVSTITNLELLKCFNNLKHLTIRCLDDIEYTVNPIIDYKILNQLSNLEELNIISNDNIKSLDISNLELKKLTLVGNHNLKQIKIKTDNLEELIISDNPDFNLNFDNSMLNNIENIKKVLLDINLFHKINCTNNIKFVEKISVGSFYFYSAKMVKSMYNLVNKIIKKYNECNISEELIIELIYKNIVEKLNYDYENLEKRDNYIKNYKNISNYNNKYKSINSSYKAITNKNVVCEGYVGLFKYFLSLMGYKSVTVYCKEKDNINALQHAALRYQKENEWLFCDPQLEEKNKPLKFFNLTKEEFEQKYELLSRDKNINEKEENNGKNFTKFNRK